METARKPIHTLRHIPSHLLRLGSEGDGLDVMIGKGLFPFVLPSKKSHALGGYWQTQHLSTVSLRILKREYTMAVDSIGLFLLP